MKCMMVIVAIAWLALSFTGKRFAQSRYLRQMALRASDRRWRPREGGYVPTSRQQGNGQMG